MRKEKNRKRREREMRRKKKREEEGKGKAMRMERGKRYIYASAMKLCYTFKKTWLAKIASKSSEKKKVPVAHSCALNAMSSCRK